MFKWLCLALAVIAVAGFAWMVNDMRLDVKQTSERLNERLPQLLARLDRVTQTVEHHMPQTLKKTEAILETFAELTQDVKQLKELWAGVHAAGRDKSLVAYANSVLQLLETQQGANIGLKPFIGRGLTSLHPAPEWVAGARKEAVVLTFLANTRADLLTRLCRNIVGRTWYIQFGDKEPMPLRDWIKRNHRESKDL